MNTTIPQLLQDASASVKHLCAKNCEPVEFRIKMYPASSGKALTWHFDALAFFCCECDPGKKCSQCKMKNNTYGNLVIGKCLQNDTGIPVNQPSPLATGLAVLASVNPLSWQAEWDFI